MAAIFDNLLANPKQETSRQKFFALLDSARLYAIFQNFSELISVPRDLRLLTTVARNLIQNFDQSYFRWKSLKPFRRWDELLGFLLDHQQQLEEISIQKPSAPKSSKDGVPQRSRNPMFGDIGDFPIYAMLCDRHESDELYNDYAALQMQFLFVRWYELQRAKKIESRTIAAFEDGAKIGEDARHVRVPDSYARAVRDLSGSRFAPLLKNLKPCCSPAAFRRIVRQSIEPPGKNLQNQFARIRNFCDPQYNARELQPRKSGYRSPRRVICPDFFDSSADLLITTGARSQSNSDTHDRNRIYRRKIKSEEAEELGLAPEELTGGELIINCDIPDAADYLVATTRARDSARGYQIDRRLFPWNSQALRLEEVHDDLIPAIISASSDDTLAEEDLTAMTLVAVIIEAGRDLDDALNLYVGRPPDRNRFGFQLPESGEPTGRWSWPPATPRYLTHPPIPNGDVERADYLSYRASTIMTTLICRLCARLRICSGKLFRTNLDYEDLSRNWLASHNARGRYTLPRFANLRWTLMHAITDGDLASQCFTLGVHKNSAGVQLHYGILQVREARNYFEKTTVQLWGNVEAPFAPLTDESDSFFVGCRAFPRIDVVQEVVAWLREESKAFFQMKLLTGDLTSIREKLNSSVMYLLWHQFFSFGTRAIIDAYQEKSAFSDETGIGILSDKDFADGYKTRIIWADRTLRRHMAAVEERLAKVASRHALDMHKVDSSVWFLDELSKPIIIRPAEIARFFGPRFSFPINTPRKIMRNLLRKHGMSCESAEVFMGHWSHGREPWSSLSTFDFGKFISELRTCIPDILITLGFTWIPGVTL
jgi:hypothetical protein